jgi:outer membrane murein-binding lipoprotein Lpp
MRKLMFLMLIGALLSGILVSGCSKDGTALSSAEAIDIAKTLESTQEKIDFLTKEANALYRSEKFQDVVDITQYILTYLERDSKTAKDLLDKAKAKLLQIAQERAGELENKLDSFGK